MIDPTTNPVDVLRDMDDLYGFPDNCVAALYCRYVQHAANTFIFFFYL